MLPKSAGMFEYERGGGKQWRIEDFKKSGRPWPWVPPTTPPRPFFFTLLDISQYLLIINEVTRGGGFEEHIIHSSN